MYRNASVNLGGMRVLVVEAEADVAAQLASGVVRAGGISVGIVGDVAEALAYLRANPLPQGVILDVRHAGGPGRPLADLFADFGITAVFVTGFDDWFVDEEEELVWIDQAEARG